MTVNAGLEAIKKNDLILFNRALCKCSFLDIEILLYTLCADQYTDRVEYHNADNITYISDVAIRMISGCVHELNATTIVSKIIIENASVIARMYKNVYAAAYLDTYEAPHLSALQCSWGDLFVIRVMTYLEKPKLKKALLSAIDTKYYNWDAMTCGPESIIANHIAC